MRRILVVAVSVSMFVASSFTVAAEQPGVQGASAVRGVSPRVVTSARGGGLTTIQGNALDSTNGPLPNTVVRLRNARNGGIADTQVTDSSGLFTFKSVDPGSYIVEIMGKDESILAAGQMLNVGAGDSISAIVKLPFRLSPLAGLLATARRRPSWSSQRLRQRVCCPPQPRGRSRQEVRNLELARHTVAWRASRTRSGCDRYLHEPGRPAATEPAAAVTRVVVDRDVQDVVARLD